MKIVWLCNSRFSVKGMRETGTWLQPLAEMIKYDMNLSPVIIFNDSAEFLRHLQNVYDLKSSGQLNDVKKDTERFFKSEFNIGKYMQRYISQLESYNQITENTPPRTIAEGL